MCRNLNTVEDFVILAISFSGVDSNIVVVHSGGDNGYWFERRFSKRKWLRCDSEARVFGGAVVVSIRLSRSLKVEILRFFERLRWKKREGLERDEGEYDGAKAMRKECRKDLECRDCGTYPTSMQ
ncbi:hypothetical protein L2E82_16746 [Cichorium intybus]|uniref:Uncharacterized protein n=1 Tax=Cichorium intybus TaxID=13427 RepID=A0ACB9F7Q0_CICIN|nr:hypothetical protein L2E82_16746 [Cichorium intybus]